MSQGKYSPYCNPTFIPDRWETGLLGTVEVDKDGFDSYGYNADGRDRRGFTENDYLFMDEDTYSDHVFGTSVARGDKLSDADKLKRLKDHLEQMVSCKAWTTSEVLVAAVARDLLNQFFKDEQ